MKRFLLLAVLVAAIVFLFVVKSKKIEKTPPLAKRPEAVVAFVIDDWGYNKKYISILSEINRPITISILPNLNYSRFILDNVKKLGPHDVILHLPLESISNYAPEKDTIRVDMPDEEIRKILTDDIESLPGIAGVSNHQGSKATKDKRVMKIVFNELKERGLFFLDSVTTPESISSKVAKETKVKFIERDVFLDITDQTDALDLKGYVKKQLQELVDTAKKNKKAVGVGHNLEITLNAIKEYIPEMEAQGIKIVPLKEIVR
ncbi:MAG: divergent polysaccharide deacetylase family protein [Candidatus Omnitrophota bacterium]